MESSVRCPRRAWLPCLWLLFLLIAAAPVWAQDQAAPVPPSAETVTQEKPTYPGLAEVLPRKSSLQQELVAVQNLLVTLRDTKPFEKDVTRLEESQQELEEAIASYGELSSWSIDRLQDVRSQLGQQRNEQRDLLQKISERLSAVETLQEEWDERRAFWEGWQESLGPGLPRKTLEAFRETRVAVSGVVDEIGSAALDLVNLQSRVSAVLTRGLSDLKAFDAALGQIRRELFSRVDPSFFSPRFYRQFDASFWDSTVERVAQVQWLQPGFLERHAWLIGCQLLVMLLVAGGIRWFRSRQEVRDEWLFLARRPWSSGLFVAMVGGGPFVREAPPLVTLVAWGLLLGVAVHLVSGLLTSRRRMRVLIFLAVSFIGYKLMESLFLPLPLQRIYLFAVALVAVWLFLAIVRDERRENEALSGFALLLIMAGGIFAVACIAQLAGYSTLALRLTASTVQTGFVVILVWMTLRLGRGGIDFLLGQAWLDQFRFFSRFGRELAERLKTPFQVWLVVQTSFYLLVLWGVFDSVGEAWETLSTWGMTIGETAVNLGMFFWAGLVLYLAFQVSWLVRALLEVTVLKRRRYDRGVRDAVKKLVHYSLLCLGALLALSTAGVDPRVFALVGGAFGIGIGFGLQNIVNNFVSGIILLFERPIKVGDTIVIDGEWGTVKKIGLRSTVFETLDQAEVIVPNSQLISEKVTNWSLSSSMARVVMPVGVAYGSDVGKVLEILAAAGKGHPLAVQDPAPSAIFTGFGDSSLDFELRVWIADIRERLRVRSEVFHAIEQGLRKAGVEIPFPQRDLHLRTVDPDVAERLRGAPPAKPPSSK